MTKPVAIGNRGQTNGPLRPCGKIRIDGQLYEACSEGSFIDADADVIVVGGRSQNLVVRAASEAGPALPDQGTPISVGEAPDVAPVQAPPAPVEQINAVPYGAAAAGVAGLVAWLAGTELSFSAALTPVAGALAGAIFNWFVKGPKDFVGPRQDHRPLASVFAVVVPATAVLGAVLTIYGGLGFVGLNFGIVLGALFGGAMMWIFVMVTK